MRFRSVTGVSRQWCPVLDCKYFDHDGDSGIFGLDELGIDTVHASSGGALVVVGGSVLGSHAETFHQLRRGLVNAY